MPTAHSLFRPLEWLAVVCAVLALLSSKQAYSRELLLLSSDGPPHMIAASNSGIDIDIVKHSLRDLGHEVKVEFMPLKRAMEQVRSKAADVFLPTFFQQDTKDLFFSDQYIHYRPTIFTLKKKHIKIDKFSDLEGLSVLSFQGATGYFGEEFKQAVQKARYTELHMMSTFPKILLNERFDVVVLDYFIFYYFLKIYHDQNIKDGGNNFPGVENYTTLIAEHDLIPRVKAHAAFNDKSLRDEFNRSLKNLANSDMYQQIIDSYIGEVSEKNLGSSALLP